MGKKKNENKKIKIRSTQIFSPIRDIRDGIIITKDGRFIKIMEITPINFGLRSEKEREGIVDNFAAVIKLLPRNTQWKIVSYPANVTSFVERIRDDMTTEENENCRNMQEEQIRLIRQIGAQGGVSRRFFIMFEYEQPVGVYKRPPFEDIYAELETTAFRIANVLAGCGNEVISPQGDDMYTLEVLYSIFCRGDHGEKAFERKFKEVVTRYMADESFDTDAENSYIPVNDFICPATIDSVISPKYIVVDGVYYSFAYLPSSTFPTKTTSGWLSILTDIGIGVDVDVFLHKENIESVQRKLQYALRFNKLKAKDTEDTSTGYDEILNAIDSGFYIRNGISNGEDFIYMSILLTVCAGSPEELREKCNAIKVYLATHNLKAKYCLFQHEEAFLSALPLCRLQPNIQAKSKRNILGSDLAGSYPFASFEVADPNGIMYGVNKANNTFVFIDNFDTRQYKNANMVILGTSGAGKTYTLQCLALRMREQKTQVFIIAPEKGHEFKRACDAVGGQYVKISAGSGQNINIMEIRKRDTANTELIDGEYGAKDSILAKKIQQIHIFMTLLIPDITYEERQQLDEALVKTYAKFGITNRNRSLIDPEHPERYKKMPVLQDLHETLSGMGEPARRLHNILTRYVTGSAKSFNAQTNVNLNNKYIVLDISDLTKELLPIGMFIALDYVYDKAREDRTARKAIFIDEAWVLMGAQNFVTEVFKVIRGYGGAAVAATQDMQDFFDTDGGKFGKAVISNAKTKIIMQMEQEEAGFVGNVLDLSAREIQQITRFKRGEGLLVSNTNHVLVSFRASQTENDLITTDREQLQRIAERKAREKAFTGKT